jgi:anti-sigma factor RsiW
MTAGERRTGPPTGHADLDTLADLHAGVLVGPAADRVREHVDGCPQCAATLEALDAVQGQLRALPGPAMPAAVAARLDAALAELRTERPVAVGATAADPEDELARARLRRSRRLSRTIGAAAAAVVVIAAGGAIASVVRGGGASETTSSAGGGVASAPAQPQAQAATPPEGGSVANDSGGRAAPPEYDRAGLRAALPTIAARGTVPRATSPDNPTLEAACATSIPGATGTLRGAERIRYEGRPAYVFVYADGDRLTGFVVTEGCGSQPGQPATVLDTVS